MSFNAKILSKLIEKRVEGIPKSKLIKSKEDETIFKDLLKNGLIKVEKGRRGEKVFITEKGELEFIKNMEKDQFEDYLSKIISQIEGEIKKLNENFENLIKILSIRTNQKAQEKSLYDEIYKVYKDLSSKDYSYLGGLVPIPSIVSYLIQKGNLKVDEIHRALYELYLKGELTLEYGDKKEGNLVTPDGKSFYYVKFKKWKIGKRF